MDYMRYKNVELSKITKEESLLFALEKFEYLYETGSELGPEEYQIFSNHCPLCQYVLNIDLKRNPQQDFPTSCVDNCPVKWLSLIHI